MQRRAVQTRIESNKRKSNNLSSDRNVEVTLVRSRVDVTVVHELIQCRAAQALSIYVSRLDTGKTYLIAWASPRTARAIALTWMPSVWFDCERMKLIMFLCSSGRCANWSFAPFVAACAVYTDAPFVPAC